LDDSVSKNHKFSEIWVFSYDGQGSDFVERVNLEDLNEFSNYTEESKYFSRRIESILNSQHVKMTVEVLSDGKGNRMLRALHVSWFDYLYFIIIFDSIFIKEFFDYRISSKDLDYLEKRPWFFSFKWIIMKEKYLKPRF
jgi:hypothetical protein